MYPFTSFFRYLDKSIFDYLLPVHFYLTSRGYWFWTVSIVSVLIVICRHRTASWCFIMCFLLSNLLQVKTSIASI